MSSDSRTVALFDVGGTNTRLATKTPDGLEVLTKVETQTDQYPLEFLQSLLAQNLQSESVESVVLALPGEISQTTLIDANNLPEWNGVDFQSLIAGSITVINDADAAGLGEAHFGAGRELDRFGYVTISTGIGGGLIEHGKLASNQFGFEVGEQIIDWQTGAGLEQLAGGVAVRKKTGKLTGQLRDIKELEPVVAQLASGLFNTALLWSTDRLVVNGPALFESEQLWSMLQDRFNQIQLESGLKQELQLLLAELEDNAGLYGCLALADSAN